MPLLLGFAARFWKPAVFVMLIGALFLYREVIVHQRDTAREQVALLKAESERCRDVNSQMSAALAEQNRRVAALKADAARSASLETARVKAAQETAEREVSSGRRKAAALLNARVGTTCKEAIRWGNLQGPALGRW